MFRIEPKLLIIFVFCIFALVFLNFSGLAEMNDMRAWVVDKGTDDWYAYPAIKYIGLTGFSFFGENFFFAFPFSLFFGAIVFLWKTVKTFNLNQKAYFLCLFIISYAMKAIGFFNRDNIMFFLGAAYSYYFFKTIYEKDRNIFALIVINALMFFFRELALFFAILTIIVIFRIMFHHFNNKLELSLISSAVYVAPPLEKTVQDLIQYWKLGIDSFLVFKPQNLFKYFNNTVFGVSLLVFAFRPCKWHALIILLTFIYVYSIVNTTEFYSSVFRYSFSLTPLHIFFIAKNFGGNKWE